MCLFTEIRKIQLSARDHFQKILNDHEKLKLQLESQKKELEMRGSDLEKREAKNESDRKLLSEEIEKVCHIVLDWHDSCLSILIHILWHGY